MSTNLLPVYGCDYCHKLELPSSVDSEGHPSLPDGWIEYQNYVCDRCGQPFHFDGVDHVDIVQAEFPKHFCGAECAQKWMAGVADLNSFSMTIE